MFPLDQFSPNWFSLPILVAGVGMLALGVTVAVREQGSRVGLAYLALALTIAVWLLSYAVMYSTDDARDAAWWIRVAANFGVSLLPITAWHLTTQFVPRRSWLPWAKAAALAVALAYWAASVTTDLWVEEARRYWWGHYAHYGWVGYSFIGYLAVLLGAALFTLIVANRSALSPRARARTQGLILAYAAGYPAAVDFVPVFGIPMYPFGYLFIVAFIVLTARIVWRYRLVDVTPHFASNQIVATMSEGLLVVDGDGIIRVVNRTAERLLVPRNVRLAHRSAARMFPDLPFLHGTDLLVAQGGTSSVGFTWASLPGGEQRYLRARSTIMYGARNLPAAVVCVLDDVTDEIRSAENLRATNRQLATALSELGEARTEVVRRERFKALGEMVTGIAHDFNNALTPILGFSELLKSGPHQEWTEADTTAVNAIYTSAQDAAGMVFRLRDWYRPSEDSAIYAPVDLSRIVETVATLTRPVWETQAQARQVAISMRLDLTPRAFVSGVEAELREVLTNLIINAVDAMPNGGAIAIATSADGANVTLALSDTGTGMDEATLSRCFEPYFSTKGSRGTGLGLPMVRSIVQRHGGTVDVESTVGVGTTFRFSFPIAEPAAEPSTTGEAPPVLARQRILLVDDIPMSAEAMATFLEVDGHDVYVTTDPVEAEGLLRTTPFDYLVTDLAMPKIDGLELCRIARTRDAELKTVIVTGFGDLAESGYFDSPNVDAIAKKPVAPSSLRDAMARAAAAYRIRSRAA